MVEYQTEAETLEQESLDLVKRNDFKGAMFKAREALDLFPALKTQQLVAVTEILYAASQTIFDIDKGRPQRNYYRVLGTDYCDVKTLKKNFRKLTKLVHPDKNSLPCAAEACVFINEANECLGTVEGKRWYDQEWMPSWRNRESTDGAADVFFDFSCLKELNGGGGNAGVVGGSAGAGAAYVNTSFEAPIPCARINDVGAGTFYGGGSAGDGAAGGSTSFEAPTGGDDPSGVGGGSAGADAADGDTSFEAPTASAAKTDAADGNTSFETPTASANKPRRSVRTRKNPLQSDHDSNVRHDDNVRRRPPKRLREQKDCSEYQFVVKMTKSHDPKEKKMPFVSVPAAKVRLFGLARVLNLKIELKESQSGKIWPVIVTEHQNTSRLRTHPRIALTHGWCKFYQENNLVDDDLCYFN